MLSVMIVLRVDVVDLRPCLTLLDTIRSDLKRRKISNSLRSISDFENLRVIALDRVKWKSFEKM